MKCKILVVEDEIERYRDTKEHLYKIEKNLNIVWSLTVDGALRRLRSEHYSLVVLDIGLGDASARGNELLTQLKADSKLRNIPVIVLSAIDDKGVRELCLREGALTFFLRNSDEFRDGFAPKVKNLLGECTHES